MIEGVWVCRRGGRGLASDREATGRAILEVAGQGRRGPSSTIQAREGALAVPSGTDEVCQPDRGPGGAYLGGGGPMSLEQPDM